MKPGMSAQVEILVKTLPDVLYVPIQAVVPSEGQKICYVAGLVGGPARRVIEDESESPGTVHQNGCEFYLGSGRRGVVNDD